MTSHDSIALRGSLIVLALLSGACTDTPAEDPCAASELLRTCSDNIDALVDLSQVGTLDQLGEAYMLRPEGVDVASYYGALYLSSQATNTVNIELTALAADGTETCPSVNGDVASGGRKWIGIDAETTSISVSVDGTYVGSIGEASFDAKAGSTAWLRCQDTTAAGGPEFEILPVDGQGPNPDGQVRRFYLSSMSCAGGPCVIVDNTNARGVDMRVLFGTDDAASAGTCTSERNYTWEDSGVVVPGESGSTEVVIGAGTLALGFVHDGTALADFAPDQGVNFLEIVDPNSSVVRFEKVPGCASDEQELPVAVPFVATRSDTAPANAPTCEFASGCTWVEFHNCTASDGTVTPWAGEDVPVSIGAGATVAIPIDAGGVRQEAWAWETGDDPTVIIRKKKGCDM